MRIHPLVVFAVAALCCTNCLKAEIRYVDVNSATPTPPYTNWGTAAQTIQDAIDVSSAGDVVLVTNGVYETGATPSAYNSNRVSVMSAITVESVNGPAVTIIKGYQVPGTTNGAEAVRCVGLVNGARLAGFTLTNGATGLTGSGGGVYSGDYPGGVVSNCIVAGNSAYSGGGACLNVFHNCTFIGNSAVSAGGAALSSTFSNCTLIGNSAYSGGGVHYGVLNNCLVVSNTASYGGGAAGDEVYPYLNNCTLVGNTALNLGGGVIDGILTNCIVAGNAGYSGGGAYRSKLTLCTLTGNTAQLAGGGAYFGELHNCLVVSNRADFVGGAYALLNNCTVAANTATNSAGGVGFGSTVNHSIVYFNSAPLDPNFQEGADTLTHCCTFPLPSGGTGNFSNAPLFVDLPAGNARLQANSPCVNDGLFNTNLLSADLDGNPRLVASAIDLGAYEVQSPASELPHMWLLRYGLATDGSADGSDSDGDGSTSRSEFYALTNPTNAASVFRITSVTNLASGFRVTWSGTNGLQYFVERSTNLVDQPAFVPIASNITALESFGFFTDTNTPGQPGPFFYRVGVQ